MTTENKTVATVIEPISVSRNETSTTFKQGQVMRGEDKGWIYPVPEISENNVSDWVTWVGLKNVAKKLGAIVKQLAQGWWGEALKVATDEATGVVDMDKAREVFAKLAAEFSARGESIPELKSQIEELVNSMTSLDFVNDPEAGIKAKEYSEQIKELQMDIQLQRRAPRKPKAEKTEEAAS